MANNSSDLSGKFDINPMKRVWYGVDCLEHPPEEVDRFGGRKVFIIASASVAEKTDLVPRITKLLGGKVVGVSAASKQHVPRQSVLDATEDAREKGVDFIISLGGGSQVDCAKAVAFCLGEGLSTRDELDEYRVIYEYPDRVTIPPVKNHVLPHISVSTTISAGEFTNIIGITDEARKVKDLYIDDQFTPEVAFMDPFVTVATPSWLWAATGMRAVDHSVEGFISKTHTPFTDALCFNALKILFEYLPVATREPENLQAKVQCQLAAWMSIFGLNNVLLGVSHGIGHQLGARCNVVHGVTSAIMLPHALEFNLPVTMERQAALAEAMGVDTRGKTTEQAAHAGISALREFVQTLGLPNRLRDVNVTREDFDGIVKDAMEDFILATNPRTVQSEDVYALLEGAY